MRMFMRVKLDVDASSQAIKDGRIGKIFEAFANQFKPEGMWFLIQEGQRGVVAVFDLPSTSKIVPVVEPFFSGLGATVELTPAMDLADLQAGMSALK